MFDDEDLLCHRPEVRRLFEHYAQVSAEDDSWQDRLAELAGVSRRELVELHGALLSEEWIEQNTGVVPVRKPGVVAGCYRVTTVGRRALTACGAPGAHAA